MDKINQVCALDYSTNYGKEKRSRSPHYCARHVEGTIHTRSRPYSKEQFSVLGILIPTLQVGKCLQGTLTCPLVVQLQHMVESEFEDTSA